MQDYQQRVVDEADALQVKIEALEAFLKTSKYEDLQEIDQQLLAIQLSSMITYFGMLHMRIDRF